MLPLKVEAMQKNIYVFVPKYHKKDEKIHSKLNSDICNTHTHTHTQNKWLILLVLKELFRINENDIRSVRHMFTVGETSEKQAGMSASYTI